MLWWIIAAVCAFFVKGICGFANTLVFTTFLSFGNSNVNISPVELILGYPSNAIIAWKERKSIIWKVCLPIALLVIVGSIPGVFFLKNVNANILKLIFGVIIILLSLEMLLREFHPVKTRQNKIILTLIGICSGILCGLYGIGALLGAYLGRITEGSHSFKANLCVVFFIENTFRLFLYIFWGVITPDILKQALILVPFMLVGLGAGMLCGAKIKEQSIKRIVIVALMLSGVALVINNL